MMRQSILVSALVVLFAVTFCEADLWDRGGGLIYDDVLDITWLQNANYAAAELSDARINDIISAVGSVDGHMLIMSDFEYYGGHRTGEMSWWGAVAWADQLIYGGYDDWRLPGTDDSIINPTGSFGYQGPDQNGNYNYRDGFNMVNSEMGYLYYETLGNKGLYATDGTNPQPGWGLQNTGPFMNLQANDYWSGSEFAHYTVDAWYMTFQNGFQNVSSKDGNRLFTWAVRDGDVEVIPAPSAVILGQHWRRLCYLATET